VGIDASPTLVRLAVTHPERETAVLADAARLPFPDEAFDLVVAYMSLHDIDEMAQAVAEAARVLGRSGRLCAAIPHPVNTAGDFPAREAAAPFVITGSYLDPGPANWVFNRGGIRMTFHSAHRPLESYVRALEAGGLLIEAIREPKPPGHVVTRDPAAERWRRIPCSCSYGRSSRGERQQAGRAGQQQHHGREREGVTGAAGAAGSLGQPPQAAGPAARRARSARPARPRPAPRPP
jgi:SAM-dependent methyltransferase